ncbi:MAG TPA: LptF/LptG family permease [Gemmatimonadales bacterium]|nr:LptF/LptG family permease [Gemmatimonadales bacterium]
MRLLSRHILVSLAAPFGWGVVALSGMLLMNQLSMLIDRFGGKGLPASVMAEAILLALPALLTLTLPMAVLTAALYAYGQLAADLEMVAMYANGVSVWRMARPALIAAVGVALLNFIIFDQVVPRSNARFTTLQQDVLQKLPTLTLRPQVLNPLQGTEYILQAAEIDPISGEMRDVVIYDLSSNRGTRVIRAARGVMGEAPNRTDLLLTLFDGEMHEAKMLEPGRLERTAFKTNQVRVAGVASIFTRREGRWDRSDRELTGCELLAGIDSASWYRKEGKAQRELLTRRDIRGLAGLPSPQAPAVRPMPALPPRCVAYQPVEHFFERLMLGRNAPEPDTTPSEAVEAARVADSIAAAAAAKAITPAPRLELPSVPVPAAPAPAPVALPTPAVTMPPTQDSAKATVDSAPKQRPKLRVALDSVAAAADSAALITTAVPPTATPVPADTTTVTSVQPLDAAAAQPLATAPQGGIDQGIGQESPFLVPPEVPSTSTGGLRSTIVDVNSARYQDEQNLKTTRKFAVEYHKKFAIPLAAFSFVLVAMALALKYPRSGIGLVIGGSLVIFLGFYILLIGGENLADVGFLSPAMAMYAPLVIFTLLGIAAVASANREMGTSRTSGILQAFGEMIQSLAGRLRRQR